MPALIRPYRKTDAPALLAIINDSIVNTTHNYDYHIKSLKEVEETFTGKILEGFPVLVLEIEGEACGYASFGKFRTKPGYNTTVEHSIYLKDSAQGKGYGALMMLNLMQIASEKGYHVMIAGMDGENTGSYRFHERLGFREVARFPEVAFKHGKWLELVFMQILLTDRNSLG